MLLQHNAKVYIGARDRRKAEAAIEELKEVTGREALFLELNLANLASVRKAAETFLAWVPVICYEWPQLTIFQTREGAKRSF